LKLPQLYKILFICMTMIRPGVHNIVH